MTMNTCLHHNDAERSGAGCPVCARAEVERLKAELANVNEAHKRDCEQLTAISDAVAKLLPGETVYGSWSDHAEALILHLCDKLERTERAAAEMREALERLACLGNEPMYGNSVGNIIALQALTANPTAGLGYVRASDILRDDTPWPLTSVLEKLADAADHLLTVHSCDAHGYEGIAYARGAARSILTALKKGAK